MKTDMTPGSESRPVLKRRGTRAVLVLFVLMAAAACVMILVLRKKSPEKAGAEAPALRNMTSRPGTPDAPAGIRGRGVVSPKVRVQIMPEVSGRVVYTHSQLHAGGVIRANERILQIDPSSYELFARQARAAMDDAQARLDLALSATGLYEQQGRPLDSERQVALPRILREPQIRQAEAALESAKVELARAELHLSRTSVVLPYDVLIIEKMVSLGQYVEVGRPLATGCGTETFEIEVPIPDKDLARLDGLGGVSFPGQDPQATPAAAEVKAVCAGIEHTWHGRVVRTTGEVDRGSGMVSVIVEVPQPLDASAGRPPLLPGTAVEVLISGNPKIGTVQDHESVGDL